MSPHKLRHQWRNIGSSRSRTRPVYTKRIIYNSNGIDESDAICMIVYVVTINIAFILNLFSEVLDYLKVQTPRGNLNKADKAKTVM